MRLLVTGGAGFIGCNFADHRMAIGDEVVVLDNLSRPGTDQNLWWLQSRHAGRTLSIVQADVRDYETLARTVRDVDVVVHLAGQVAVTTSVQDPRADFEINALGTFNVLEAVRANAPAATVLYASTNKVYGRMEQLPVVESETRYEYQDRPFGVDEAQPLDFHSPYGCSKGAGDQYVRDYARIYDLKTVVFRQSCIYGPRQFGIEDQGWVAHFCIAAALGRPISIYGDGKQVRDLLWVGDLVRAFDAAIGRTDEVRGRVFNIGGGSANAISIWTEFSKILSPLAGKDLVPTIRDWRPGDQRVYVSDIRKAQAELDWSPSVKVADGIGRLWEWVSSSRALF